MTSSLQYENKITEESLEKWVLELVPKELGPDKDLAAGKPLLGVYLVEQETLEKSNERYGLKYPQGAVHTGDLCDMGLLAEMAGFFKPRLNKRYIIRINKELPEHSTIFTLLHEVGHLVGLLKDSEKHKKDREKFADDYALTKALTISDTNMRTKVVVYGVGHPTLNTGNEKNDG
ncbi:MAG TPA: hypothetical protein ENI23_10840 [bacterium]|nr:hypothetical protein [bacterium]